MQATFQQDFQTQTEQDSLWSDLFRNSLLGGLGYWLEPSINLEDESAAFSRNFDFDFQASLARFGVDAQPFYNAPGTLSMGTQHLSLSGAGFPNVLLTQQVSLQPFGGFNPQFFDTTIGGPFLMSRVPAFGDTGRIMISPEMTKLFSMGPSPEPPVSMVARHGEEKRGKKEPERKRIQTVLQDRIIMLPKNEQLSDDPEFDDLLRKAREEGPGDPMCPFPRCITNFQTTRVLAQHLRTVHNIERSDRKDRVKCLIPGCSSMCKPSDGSLVRHYKAHVLRVTCPYPQCVAVLARCSGMKRHVLAEHGVWVNEGRYFTPRFMKVENFGY